MRRVRTAITLTLVALTSVLAVVASTPRPKDHAPWTIGYEENIGQWKWNDGSPLTHVDACIRFAGVTAYVHPTGMHMVLQRRVGKPADTAERVELEQWRVDMRMVGANATPRLTRDEVSEATSRYLFERFGRKGAVARTHGDLVYHDVWPGIDLRMYVTAAGPKYDYIVHPSADPSLIAMMIDGAASIALTDNGGLTLATPLGTLGEAAPVCYTLHADGRTERVSSSYTLTGTRIGFELGNYDRTATLIIDPQRVWATYYAGNSTLTEVKVAFAGGGDVVLTGATYATNLPTTPGVLQRTKRAEEDGYVARFNDAGKHLWSTYFGGNGRDVFRDVACDTAGHAWCVGFTNSTNLLVGLSPIGDDTVAKIEALLMRLDRNGAEVDSWTMGHREQDLANCVALHGRTVVVGGYTYSNRMGGQFGKYQTRNLTLAFPDAFVVRFSPNAQSPETRSKLDWFTFLGGDSFDEVTGIAIDSLHNVYVGGQTMSLNFPVSPGAAQGVHGGGTWDAFVFKFSDACDRIWGTYYGGNDIDQGKSLALDQNLQAVIVGNTGSGNLPTLNPFKGTYSGLTDGFVSAYTAAGALRYATYYGGDSSDLLTDVAVDQSGSAWVIGSAYRTTNITTTADAYQTTPPNPGIGPNSFFAAFSTAGTRTYATWHAAPGQNPQPSGLPGVADDVGADEGTSIACDRDAYLVTAHSITGLRFATTAGAFQDSSVLRKDTIQEVAFAAYWSNCRDSVITIVNNGTNVLCAVDSRQLVGPAGFETYLWSSGQKTRTITATQPGTYILTCTTVQGCRYRDTLVLTSAVPPTVTASANPTICRDSSAQLNATASAGTAPYRYKWNRIETGPEFIDNDTIPNPKVNPGTQSRYEITVTDSLGCTAKDTVTVFIQNPAPTIVETLVQFGSLDACQSAKDTIVTVRNSETYDVFVSAFSSTRPEVSLVSSLSPPVRIAPGAPVQFTVRIAPTAAGVTSGSMTFSGLPCSWKATVPFEATKQKLTVSAAPSAIDFGASVDCENVDRDTTITIRNDGTDMVTLQPGTVGAPFSITEPTAVTQIPAGTTLTVKIRYAPTGTGTFADVVRFAFNSGACNDTIRVNVGASRAGVSYTTSLTSITFPNLTGCETSTDTVVTITNTSGVPVVFNLMSSSPNFTVTPSVTIQPGTTADVTVTFVPQANGAAAGTISITSDPCSITQTLSVSGQKDGIVLTSTPSVDFGEVATCEGATTATRTFSINYASGSGDAIVESVSVNAGVTTSLTPGTVITLGSSPSFQTTWTPTADGALVDSIVVILQPCSVRQVIRLNGTRTSVNVTSLDPNVDLGPISAPTNGQARFRNTGSDTVRVQNTTATGGIVSITTSLGTTPFTLLPGAEVTVSFSYTCRVYGAFNDTLALELGATCFPSILSAVQGTCVTTQAATTELAIDTATVNTGERASVALRIVRSSGLTDTKHKSWSAMISYNPLVLVGTSGTPDCYVPGQNDMCSITVSGTRGADTVGSLLTMNFTALLGNAEFSDLLVESFTWTDDQTASFSATSGRVTIGDICREGGVRLLGPTSSTYMRLFPSPASTDVTLEVYNAGTQPGTAAFYDYLGSEILTTPITPDVNGFARQSIDVRSIPQGLYFVVVSINAATLRTSLIIER
jgi:hypothetical protein